MLIRSVKYTSILRTRNQIIHGLHCYLESSLSQLFTSLALALTFYPHARIIFFEISSLVYGCVMSLLVTSN
jgi:hypothetical protein